MRTDLLHNARALRRLATGLAAAAALASAVVVSSWGDKSGLGAPAVWAWLLTGIQVLALWAAGRGWWWGWLLGGLVQIPWIAYAATTDQIGFLPGCAVSASVQIGAFFRAGALVDRRNGTQQPLQAVAA